MDAEFGIVTTGLRVRKGGKSGQKDFQRQETPGFGRFCGSIEMVA
jgi:hypothetical protein